MNKLLVAAGSALMLVGGSWTAYAGTAGPVVQNSQAMQDADKITPKTSIREQIENQLTRNGYSDVKIMPSSFLIQAKDKQGNPVEMVIGPDSFTEVTEVAPASTSSMPPNSMSKGAATSPAPTPAPKT